MCSSIHEFGFKIPCLVRSDGEVVDGHLRLKAARKLGITEIPVILCDEWTPAQVKAFRLMVNRSVTWADWDEELLALELQEIQESDFDLSLTGLDLGEIDSLLALDDEEKANATPPLPESPVSRPGDLWLLGPHRVLCGDATNAETVSRLLGERKPRLMVTDPPYGIELDSEWRDRAGLNGHGPARWPASLDLRVFPLSLLEDRNAILGIFPGAENILVFGASFHYLTRMRIGARQTQMGQHPYDKVTSHYTVLNDLLELCGCGGALPGGQQGLCSDVGWNPGSRCVGQLHSDQAR
jgi:hypothetical protein